LIHLWLSGETHEQICDPTYDTGQLRGGSGGSRDSRWRFNGRCRKSARAPRPNVVVVKQGWDTMQLMPSCFAGTLPDKGGPPSFQSIAYQPSTTGISLNVFLHSNHNNMPDFIVSSAESNDLIAYILSLKNK